MFTNEKIIKPERKFFPEDEKFDTWVIVEKTLNEFLNEKISSLNELIRFIEKISEYKSILSEQFARKYILKTRFADNEEYSKDFNGFYANIVSKSSPYDFKIKVKICENEFFNELPDDFYAVFKKSYKNEIDFFREENIPLMIEEQKISNGYDKIVSGLSVDYNEKEYTVTQLMSFQNNLDRNVREETWKMASSKYYDQKDELNNLFDTLKELRIKMANNNGYENYRDYMHLKKKRFDYTPEDNFQFHDSVEKVVIPFLKEQNEKRKKDLNLDNLRPWDTTVSTDGKVLKPFDTIDEFIEKSLKVLNKIKPEFAINLEKMKNSDHLDLENRKGKAPGGYNYPLHETGAPFIFMNAVGTKTDVRTLLHESGHAMHSFSAKNYIVDYKSTPHEVSEVASMAMELLTLDYWTEFYPNEEDYKSAKKEQLLSTLKILPWVMIIDAFQQWIYTNPNHTAEERAEYFGKLMDRFNDGVDWTGLEEFKKYVWLKQLHVFRAPFYYIEYAIAQLGALGIYKNYKEDKEKAVKLYEEFLKVGYSKSVPEIYKAGGIEFNFSKEYISSLVEFIKNELINL